MQVVQWRGSGEGSSLDPIILLKDVDFDYNKPFNIKLENNYLSNRPKTIYFKFQTKGENQPEETLYLYGALVKDDADDMSVTADKTGRVSLFFTTLVDIADGPYSIVNISGIAYIIRQQIFSIQDLNEREKLVGDNTSSNVITSVDRNPNNYFDLVVSAELRLRNEDNLIEENANRELFVSELNISTMIATKISNYDVVMQSHVQSEISSHDAAEDSHPHIQQMIHDIHDNPLTTYDIVNEDIEDKLVSGKTFRNAIKIIDGGVF